MRIGCIGAGNIGQAVATRAVAAGHEVMLSNLRGPETLAEIEQSLGQAASAGTVEQATAFGDVVLVATPLAALDVLPATALDGKLVIDATNSCRGRGGQIEEIESGAPGSRELPARRIRGARVVKAFNTMRSDAILPRGRPAGAGARLALPVAGD